MKIEWKGGLRFESLANTGELMAADAPTDVGGDDSAPSPMEMLYFSLGACTGIDVVSLLKKMRQDVTAYEIELAITRDTSDWPRPMQAVLITHIVHGKKLDLAMVEKAVGLSDEKYCSVAATLRYRPEITSQIRIVED